MKIYFINVIIDIITLILIGIIEGDKYSIKVYSIIFFGIIVILNQYEVVKNHFK